MKYKCPKCGYIFTGENNFCPNCGLKLKYHKDDKPTQNNENQTNDTTFSTFVNKQPVQNNQQYNNEPPVVPAENQQPAPQPAHVDEPVISEVQPKPEQNDVPAPERKSNAHNVLAFICSLLAAGLIGAFLMLPLFNCAIGGTDIIGVNYLDLFVYLITISTNGTVDFTNMADSLVPFILNAAMPAVVLILLAIASIVTFIGFIINLVRMIKRAPYKEHYRGNGVTALLIIDAVLTVAVTYLPIVLHMYLHDLLPEFNPLVTSFSFIMLSALFGGIFVIYLPLRIVYRSFRNKAQ